MALVGDTQLQPVNFLESYARGLELGAARRGLEQEQLQRIKAAEQERTLNELYAQSMGAGGQVDPNALMRGMAQRGLGAQIPAFQSQQAKIAQELAQAREAEAKVRLAEWNQFREELAALPAGDQARYQAWANQVLSRAPWTIKFLAPVFNDQTKRQMLMTADAALPKGEVRDIGGGVATIDPFTGNQIGTTIGNIPDPEAVVQSKERVARAGRSSTTVQLPPSELAYSQTVGKASGEADLAALNAAENAATALAKDYEALDLLRRGQPATGITADLSLQFNRLKAGVAGDKEAVKKVKDTELLNAVLGQDVFANIQALGIGARGLDTPAEREYLREVVSGTISLNQETLIRMAEIRAKIKERAIDKFNKRVESGELDRFFQAAGRPKRGIEKPAALTAESRMSAEDKAALDWANANPRDPRAAQIKQRLGVR